MRTTIEFVQKIFHADFWLGSFNITKTTKFAKNISNGNSRLFRTKSKIDEKKKKLDANESLDREQNKNSI